jgi:site-specific recombinase XerD
MNQLQYIESIAEMVDEELFRMLVEMINLTDRTKANKRMIFRVIHNFFAFSTLNSLHSLTKQHVLEYCHAEAQVKTEKTIKGEKAIIVQLSKYVEMNGREYPEQYPRYKGYVNPLRQDRAFEILDSDSYQIYHSYLDLHAEPETDNRTKIRPVFERFIEFVGKKSFLEIKRRDVENYLHMIDESGVVLVTKQGYHSRIRSLFIYITRYYRGMQLKYFNPVPSTRYWRFRKDTPKTVREKIQELEDNYYSVDEIHEIIKRASKGKYEFFIQTLLLIFCGMRVGEVVSIRIEDVLQSERYLESYGKTGLVGFCYPEEIQDEIAEYLVYHHNKYSDSEFMFPEKLRYSHSNRSHNKVETLSTYLNRISPSFGGRTNKFRKTLARFRRGNGVPKAEREFLSCHYITSVTKRHYMRRTIEERREKYEKYFPNQYEILLETVKNQ